MRPTRDSTLPVLLLCALPLAACGDDDRPPELDGSVDGGDASSPVDGSVPTDGATDAGVPPGCEARVGTPPTITVCPGDALPPPSEGSCSLTAGGAALLLTGDVLRPGEVLRGGQVLVGADGRIACVGCDCSGEPAAAAATRVTCPDSVISPGLINAHDHITFIHDRPYDRTTERYEHRHEWRRGSNGHTRIASSGGASREAMAFGELRFVLGGATSINGSGSSSGWLRNLDRDAMEGLGQPPVEYDTFPLGDSGGVLLSEGCDYPAVTTAASISGFDAYTPHVAEGISEHARNELRCVREGASDLIQPQSAFIHGVGLTPPDVAAMSADGTSLIWSPRSNVTLYGDTARVTLYRALGVDIALGTDWIATGSMNVLRELRCADELNQRYMNGHFTDEELWLMATRNAAAALAVDDAVGALAPGLVADIAIFDASARADHRAVLSAEAGDVVLVLRGGVPLYGDGALVEALPGGGATCDALDVCGRAKRACVMREVGMTLAALESRNASAYPLFFCGEPTNEPSCVPARDASEPLPSPVVSGSTRYTGLPMSGDGDGDGIEDGVDNCPCTFNPVRPLDRGVQADFDGDGIGDDCDPCPRFPGVAGCAAPESSDWDGDGTANGADTCPDVYDPTQQDRDMDGRGDACDPCPDSPNPGGEACVVTVYDIKEGTVATGSSVALTAMLVTGVGANGYFLQLEPTDPRFRGADGSGIFVYSGIAEALTPGDRVDVSRATVQDFFGQLQLVGAVISPSGSGAAPPAPVDVGAAMLVDATGTPTMRGLALDGVVVRLRDVTVTDAAPAPGPGDRAPTNEVELEGALRLDDYLHLVDPPPALAEVIPSVTGVLAFRNGFLKVLPRAPSDVLFGAPALAALEPPSAFAREGAGLGPTIPEPLAVRLSRAAAGPTTITMVAGAGLRVPDVVVPAGALSAPVPVEGLVASATPVTLTAMLDGRSAMASVRVLGAADAPRLVGLASAASTVAVGTTTPLEVLLDLPAPAGGTVVLLSVDLGGSVPASVLVPADRLRGGFDFLAGGAAATATVRASLAADVATAVIDVVDRPLGGLVINEVDYDQPGTDGAEFVELYNASGVAMDLGSLAVSFVNGSGGTEYRRVPLTGSLAPGAFLVLATTAVVVPAGVTVIRIGTDNAIQNGSPDGLALLDLGRGVVLDALSYEGAMTSVTLAGVTGPVSLVEGIATTIEDSNTGIASCARLPDGVDTDDASVDWTLSSTPTPGASNSP